MPKPLVYFLCTGNACRSQMAEGFARHLAGERWDVASAGVAPTSIHPGAVAAMAEVGIDISEQQAKGIDTQVLEHASLIITLCGDAAEGCPVTPPHIRRLHWPLPDPAKATGTTAEIQQAFRSVRDEIRHRVEMTLAETPGTTVL